MSDGIQVEVDLSKLTKGFDKLGKAGELALKQAARAIGGEAVGYAKANCPVDTGLLRNSITFAISGEEPDIKSYKADKGNGHGSYSGAMPKEKSGLAVYIGTNVKYAEKQENGDYPHKTGSKHFLKKAATEHTDRYKKIIESALAAAKP